MLACRALAVVWTSPLVAALGNSLTIPLAMLEDMFIHHQRYSLIYIIGSVQVNSEYHQCSSLLLCMICFLSGIEECFGDRINCRYFWDL